MAHLPGWWSSKCCPEQVFQCWPLRGFNQVGGLQSVVQSRCFSVGLCVALTRLVVFKVLSRAGVSVLASAWL